MDNLVYYKEILIKHEKENKATRKKLIQTRKLKKNVNTNPKLS